MSHKPIVPKGGQINEGKGLPQTTIKVPMPKVQPPKPSAPPSHPSPSPKR